MKKIKLALFVVILLLLSGCSSKNPDGSYSIGSSPFGLLKSVTIVDENDEKCEYIMFDRGITHKGNCKYCKERRDKEKEQ